MARAPETRFTRSGDVDIACQVFGGGERDIVMTMGWVTHLEVMWELPELAYFLERLASLGRVIIFDKRGTGLSDRVPGMVTLEQRAEDVGAVMDAARSERAAFVGCADGGAIGAMFAATNPERISALVLSAMAFVTTPGAIEADPASPFTSPPGSRRWPPPAKCWSPAWSGPWCSAPASRSRTGAPTRSRGARHLAAVRGGVTPGARYGPARQPGSGPRPGSVPVGAAAV